MTMPQRHHAPAMARPGVPGPRPIGRPMAATMARPVPAAHPAAMPVGRPSVPAPRAGRDLPDRRRGRRDDARLQDDRVPPRPRR